MSAIFRPMNAVIWPSPNDPCALCKQPWRVHTARGDCFVCPSRGRVYLSGPMTGMPDWNYPAFHAAAAALRDRGWEVVNPAEVNPDTTMPWKECMRRDIKALCDCDAIVLMPGWERSKGANLELHLAHRLELDVLFLEKLLGE